MFQTGLKICLHIDNKEKDNLILCIVLTQGLHDTTLEAKY